jgi:hypothetical protein
MGVPWLPVEELEGEEEKDKRKREEKEKWKISCAVKRSAGS